MSKAGPAVLRRRACIAGCLCALACALGAAAGTDSSATAQLPLATRTWRFDRNDDRLGWIVPAEARGVVMGGALWLSVSPRQSDPARIAQTRYQIYGDIFNDPAVQATQGFEILSPRGLDFSPVDGQQPQVRLTVLNLSPITDLSLKWRAQGQSEWGGAPYPQAPNSNHEAVLAFDAQSKHCSLEPDAKQWQTITCYVDNSWHGSIDQISLYALQNIRGDLWIRSIELLNGAPQPAFRKPDLASEAVVPTIVLPGISQSGFAAAFQTLDRNLIIDVPAFGFTQPFTTPGGYYTSGGWWEVDTSLATAGAKWASQSFAEGVMRGFHSVQAQNPDGRIDVYGRSAARGQVADVSQIPDFFPMAYEVARRSSDPQVRREIYDTMRKYLDWWLSPVKRDTRTGLVWGVFEETLGERATGSQGNTADLTAIPLRAWFPVDLNTMVAGGARLTSELAVSLKEKSEAAKYRQVFDEISHAINDVLWDEVDGVYYNYDAQEGHPRRRLMVSTFFPLRFGIAPPERRERLLKRLVDPAQFNWGGTALTSLAKTEADYVEAKGAYEGHAWWGNVWTERNMTVISGLEDSGRPDLAAELNWTTIREFHGRYREYLLPSTGEGAGTEGFSWTASQYIAAIVDHLFGVEYDATEHRLLITPHVPRALYGQDISLSNLILPTGKSTRVSVRIHQSSARTAVISVSLTGELPAGELQVVLAGTAQEHHVSMRRSFTATFD
jgi:hypothetical protein